MQNAAVLNAGANITGSTATGAVQWTGGKGVFIIQATQYAGVVNFQLQGPSAAWLNVNATTFSADSAIAYDLPAGQYRLSHSQGSSIAVHARIVSL